MKNKQLMKSSNGSRNRVSIIGAGSWGTSIAKSIAEKDPSLTVSMWAYEKSLIRSINEKNLNDLFLPDIPLPKNIVATNNLKEAVDGCYVILLATPSKVLYETCLKLSKMIPDNTHIGYLSKGFCKVGDEILTISGAIAKAIPAVGNRIAAVYGPSHAEEVSIGYHTCLNIASKSVETRKEIAGLLNSEYLECRMVEDIIGVELGGTLKNPAAIAAGILSILPRCGDNLAGALISEALKEMIRLGKAFGVKEETIIDISGLGDLVATALSDHSRNRRFGKDIARQILKTGSSVNFYDRIVMRFRPDYVLEKMSRRMHYLAEGAYAIEPLLEFAERNNISIPVYRSLYEILLNKKDPKLLIETVKNPEKYDEVFRKTKIQITRRKRGMEKARGSVFRNVIIKSLIDKIDNNDNLKGDFLDFAREMTSRSLEYQQTDTGLPYIPAKEEYSILKNVSGDNLSKALTQLGRIYLKEISDTFSLIAYKLFYKYVGIINFVNIIFKSNYSKSFLQKNIRISGEVKTLRQISEKSNILYTATFRSYYDFLFIQYALNKLGMHAPRFIITKSMVTNPFKRFLMKLAGGYTVDPEKFSNPVYREIMKSYLSTLLEYGVPILFFPEIFITDDAAAKDINMEVLSATMDTLFSTTEEIAIVPVELSYFRHPGDIDLLQSNGKTSLRKVMDNVVYINFSRLLYLSDYSYKDNAVREITEKINRRWSIDAYVFPHYVFCRFLKEEQYQLKLDDAKKRIKLFIEDMGLGDRYKARYLLKTGIEFLRSTKTGSLQDKNIEVNNRDTVDYFASLSGIR